MMTNDEELALAWWIRSMRPPKPLTAGDEIKRVLIRGLRTAAYMCLVMPFLPLIIPVALMVEFVGLWGNALDQKAQMKQRRKREAKA